MGLQNTPGGNRLHIGIFGRRNYGKSSLLNALTNQQISVVSNTSGTTTDPVYKAIELHGIGPCMLIDTAGFDDEGELGVLRIDKTREALEKSDIAIVVFCGEDTSVESEWIALLRQQGTPIVAVINKSDMLPNVSDVAAAVHRSFGLFPIVVSAKERSGVKEILETLIRQVPEDFERQSIVGNLVHVGDSVLLVMPQDIQAPKGRLILPQVQTIRDLLDNDCIVTCVTTDQLESALAALSYPPALMITDSQAFAQVYEKKPSETLLTSFSVLMAAVKGNIMAFVEGAAAIDTLTEASHVLIAEACTHAPLEEDIGRVKLPRLLRQKVGERLSVDVVSGPDFPTDLSPYSLIIHCGACMFNRRYVLSRIAHAHDQQVPITNYGVALAKLSGILEKISWS